VLAGGRGKGAFSNGFKGGVHKAYTYVFIEALQTILITFFFNFNFRPQEVKDLASKMLGQTLITAQTGSKGKPVHQVFIQERVYSRRELYVAILLDRLAGGPVIIGSASGGVAIEDIAKENPNLIVKLPINFQTGLAKEDAETFAKKLGFSGLNLTQVRSQQFFFVAKMLLIYCINLLFVFSCALYKQAAETIVKLYTLFCKSDCTLLEVNPLIETPKSGVVCADAKINIDDNADFRQHELFAMKDESQEDYRDVEAAKHDLNYIGLEGNIGCIVNGAGLAMATMDM